MEWILILYALGYREPSVTTARFSDKQACENAGTEIMLIEIKFNYSLLKSKYVCVPSSSNTK